jgi:hypothetical protein
MKKGFNDMFLLIEMVIIKVWSIDGASPRLTQSRVSLPGIVTSADGGS